VAGVEDHHRRLRPLSLRQGDDVLAKYPWAVAEPGGVVGRSLPRDRARAIGSAVLTGALRRLVPGLTPWVAIPACIAVYAAATMAVRTSRWLVQLVARELGSGQAAAPVERSPTSYLTFRTSTLRRSVWVARRLSS
jgi:hypothetical protein